MTAAYDGCLRQYSPIRLFLREKAPVLDPFHRTEHVYTNRELYILDKIIKLNMKQLC